MTRLDDKVREYFERLNVAGAVGSDTLWRHPFTEREKAELEAEIWALVGSEERSKVKGMGPWLAVKLGGAGGVNGAPYLQRSALLGMGEAAAELWTRVEGEMAIATAVDLLRTAKRLAPGATGAKLAAVVAEVLREYDARPTTRTLPSGKVVRQRNTSRLPSRFEPKKRADREGHTFWTKLRPILGEYVQEYLADVEPAMADSLYRDFERDINSLCEEYQSKIARVKKKGTLVFSVSRRQVIEASATLSMDPPAPGAAVDLAAARRQQRRQAKLYHPDSHGGDVSLRAQYERVMQAYQILEQYQANLGSVRKKDNDGNARGDDHHG
jgi:hypothetical protein